VGKVQGIARKGTDRMTAIPSQIMEYVLEVQRELHWPELVPEWAEFPDDSGRILFHRYETLTVAECEQATEWYSRKARCALERWVTNHSVVTARIAGRNIVYARVFRCKYMSLIGQTDSTEDDMPFAHNQWNEEPTP